MKRLLRDCIGGVREIILALNDEERRRLLFAGNAGQLTGACLKQEAQGLDEALDPVYHYDHWLLFHSTQRPCKRTHEVNAECIGRFLNEIGLGGSFEDDCVNRCFFGGEAFGHLHNLLSVHHNPIPSRFLYTFSLLFPFITHKYFGPSSTL